MKVTRLIALLLAAFVVLVTPVAAIADPYGGEDGSTTAGPPRPSGNGCYTTNVTVEGAPGDRLTLTVTNENGKVVFRKTKNAGSDGKATFAVRLCSPGDYTATGTNQDGDDLGSTQFTIPGGGSQGGPGNSGNNSNAGGNSSGGSLPSTGADNQTMLGLAGALALLLAGGVTLVAAKRRSA